MAATSPSPQHPLPTTKLHNGFVVERISTLMGHRWATKGTKIGHVRQVGKPKQRIIELHDISSGHNCFHYDAGWDPKRQAKERKMKMIGR